MSDSSAMPTKELGDADFPQEWGDTVPDKAFENRLDIVKVVLPLRIKKIGKYAFSGCTNLQVIVTQSALHKIGEWAFLSCPNNMECNQK